MTRATSKPTVWGLGLLLWGCGGSSVGNGTSTSASSLSATAGSTSGGSTAQGSTTSTGADTSASSSTQSATGGNSTSGSTSGQATASGQTTGLKGATTAANSSTSATSGTTVGATTGATGTGSSGGTSTGGTSGGSTTLPAGCTEDDYYANELVACGYAPGATCDCAMSCTSDSQLAAALGLDGGQFCETGCTTSADCFDPSTTCVSGVCRMNFCDDSTVFQACDATAPGSQDGICQILYFGTLTASGVETAFVDLCVIGGTATTNCDPRGIRSAPASLCPGADQCTPDDQLGPGGLADAGMCAQECSPDAVTGPGSCPSPLSCDGQDGTPYGYCE